MWLQIRSSWRIIDATHDMSKWISTAKCNGPWLVLGRSNWLAQLKFCRALWLVLSLIPGLALTATSAGASNNNQLLQGRVEQIFNDPNLKVPVELRAVALKLDVPAASGPHIVRAELKSFPATMRGEWNGNLTVTKSLYSDSYAKTEYEDMVSGQKNLPVGKIAESHFRFFTPRSGLLSMEPPVVRSEILSNSRRGAEKDYIYVAIADFDSENYVRSGGREQMTHKLLSNEVRMLAPNVAEQDMYVRASWRDRDTGKLIVIFNETVYRFTKKRPFELDVQMVAVDYDSKGSWWTKILLQGTLR